MARRPERRRPRPAAVAPSTADLMPVVAPPLTLARLLRSGLLGAFRASMALMTPLWTRWTPLQQVWLLRGLAALVVAWTLLTTLRPPAPRLVPAAPVAPAATPPPAAPGLTTPLATVQAYNAASLTGDVTVMGQFVDPAGPLWAEIQREHVRQTAAGETVTSTLDRWGLLADVTTTHTATLDLYEEWTSITRRAEQIVQTDRAVLVQNRYTLMRAPANAASGVVWWIQSIHTRLVTR